MVKHPKCDADGVKRILAIDGGGIKGAMPAAFLAAVEETTGERIVDHFDLIAGTSTGGIIALGLGMGVPARDILKFYRESGPAVFSQPEGQLRRWLRLARFICRPKHDPARLRAELETVFEARKFGESETRLVIPAYHRDRQSVYVFKTAHHPRFEIDCRSLVVDVALATAAAPVYFPAHRLPSGSHLLDGGIWVNNPVGLAVVEAIGVLGWRAEDLRVLSLGCTDEASILGNDPGVLGMGVFGQNVISLMLQGQSHAALGTAKILMGYPHAGGHLLRCSPQVPKGTFSMDNTNQLERLSGLGEAEAREALPGLRRQFLIGKRQAFIPFHNAN